MRCTLARSVLAGVILTVALAAPRGTAAAVVTVSDFGDSGGAGQLRTLIGAAVAGDTIVIPPGTIVLGAAGGNLDVSVDLTIVGAGPDLTIIDGGGGHRVFDVAATATAVIAGLAIRNGDAGALAGGGIQNAGTLTLVSVVVSGSTSDGGGGIANLGVLTLTASTVSGNSTTGVTAIGGGVYNAGTMTITHSTVSGNRALGMSSSANGGGIANGGAMTIVNSTISGNRANANTGGGLFQAASATSLTLTNVTIAENVADADDTGAGFGGGLGQMGAVPTIQNTLIAGNRTGRGGSAPDCSGTLTSEGHNLIQDTRGCAVAAAAGDLFDVKAHLGPLASNGGPTQTHALLQSSPAIDAGDDASCPATDQRGVARPLDGDRDGLAQCDIGAYELQRR